MTQLTETVTIDKLAFGGAGVARRDSGKVLFAHGCYPGDVAVVRIEKDKKKFSEGSLVKLEEPSENRVEPPCPHFHTCGGCPWMGFLYSAQLEWKRRIVEESLKRIGGADLTMPPIVPASEELGYRSRIRLRIVKKDRNVSIGFNMARTNDLAPIDKCIVAKPAINNALAELSQYLNAHPHAAEGAEEVTIEEGQGQVRLLIRYSIQIKEKILKDLLKEIPSASGTVAHIPGGKLERGEITLQAPLPMGRELETGAGVFTQINHQQNLKMIEYVMAQANPEAGGSGLDLFCGIGNFTYPLAWAGMAMSGIDSSKDAIEHAMINRKINKTVNAHFTEEDATPATYKLAYSGVKFDLTLLDPPRSGAKELMEALVELNPARLIYISCDPPSLSRDIAILANGGYSVNGIKTFDMFPQTSHMEVIASLSK